MNNKIWMSDYIISNQILKNDVIFSWASKPWQYQWCEDGVAGVILWSTHTSQATLESSVALSFHVEDSPSAQSSTAQHSTAILFPFTQAARVLIPKLCQHLNVCMCVAISVISQNTGRNQGPLLKRIDKQWYTASPHGCQKKKGGYGGFFWRESKQVSVFSM